MNLYTLFDRVAMEAGPLVECKNDTVAVRMALQSLQETSTPADFQLLKVGYYNHDPVSLEALETPITIPFFIGDKTSKDVEEFVRDHV